MPTYVRGDAVANATKYDLLKKNSDGTYEVLVEDASEINFEVSALSLATDEYTLVVQAQADGYEDSEYSNEVTYTVADSGGDTGGDSGNTDDGTTIEYPFNVTNWEQGSYTMGNLSTESGRIRAGYFDLDVGARIQFALNNDWQGYVCYRSSDQGHTLIGSQSWVADELFTVDSKSCNDILIVLKNSSNSNITPSDFTVEDGGTVTILAPVQS